MKQYLQIKEQNQDAILFFRLGDFYEMFGDDARKASKELDLTLTTRDKDKNKSFEEKIPMCGIPYHASDAYIARLIAKGYKVAICEQTEDPATAKGLVDRDIIRVVTPGTVIDAACLEEGRSNFCAGLYLDDTCAGFSVCDISTGKTHVTAFQGPDRAEHLLNELGRFSPAEAVVNQAAYDCGPLLSLLQDKLHCHVERLSARRFQLQEAERTVRAQFGDEAAGRLPKGNPAAALSLGALLDYLHETQKTDLRHYQQGQFMELDLTARRNLELTETLRSKEKKGSLLWVLDKTSTAMGKRLLRTWIEQPLLSSDAINHRLDAVESLVNQTVQRGDLIEELHYIADLERMMTRTVYGSATPKEIYAMAQTCERLPSLRQQAESCGCAELSEIVSRIDPLSDIKDKIYAAVDPDAPSTLKDGGVIAKGYHPEVDELRSIRDNTKGVLAQLETRLRQETGIPKLKIGYNHVFGYFIEVSNSYKAQVPESYIRKQTLTTGERYITQELKELENKILGANERLLVLEHQLFADLLSSISAEVVRIQCTASAVAQLDVLAGFAEAALQNNYVMPNVDESGVMEIKEGRHPVIEQMLKGSLFVPNDTMLDEDENRMLLITGPNMAGKSTYMRQNALIALMAQIGSFVPAAAAHIGVVDAIFTRVGASDDLSTGRSTFMVEMNEVANILRNATAKSLLILDEIGRGTSTFDGLSIAWAVVEHISNPKLLGAKTLFATHYHELTELEGKLDSVNNYCIAVKEKGDDIVFLRKIVKGGADRSYGIQVAKLAGLPDSVIERAKEIAEQLLANDITDTVKSISVDNGHKHKKEHLDEVDMTQISLFDTVKDDDIIDELRSIDIGNMTPLDALNKLYQLQNKVKNRW